MCNVHDYFNITGISAIGYNCRSAAVIPLIKVCEETTLLGQTRIANKFKSHQGCRLFGICLNLQIILHPIPWNTIAGAVDNCKLNSSSERARKISRRLFTSFIKRQIRHFQHLQWRQRNRQKSVMYVQSCCFACTTNCFFDVLVAVAVVVS